MGGVNWSPDFDSKGEISVSKIKDALVGDIKVEMPPDGRRLTVRESRHIGDIVEVYMERDSAFLFNLAQAIVLQAQRKRLRGE